MVLISIRTQAVPPKPVRLTPQELKAVPFRAFQVSTRCSVSLISCRDQIVLVAETVTASVFLSRNSISSVASSAGTNSRSPSAGPVASLEGVCPSLTLEHPACADLNTAGRSKPSALDPGNVSIISSYFPLLSLYLVSIHLLAHQCLSLRLSTPATAWQELSLERR